MRRARVADIGGEIVAHLRRIDAALLGERLIELRKRARQDEMGDVALAAIFGLFEQRLDDRRHDLGVALVADPALFPAIVEILALAAEVIDEVERQRVRADEIRR